MKSLFACYKKIEGGQWTIFILTYSSSFECSFLRSYKTMFFKLTVAIVALASTVFAGVTKVSLLRPL